MQTTEILERGRAAFDRCAWVETYERLDQVDDATAAMEPEDLERLATSAYLTGHDDESTNAWGRAHQSWLERGDLGRAVRSAFWLGFGLIQRGEMAQGGGWLARAGRLVEEHQLDTVERGYLLVPEGLMAMGDGASDTALERFGQAGSLGRRFGDSDLSALGVLGRGQTLLHMGRTSEGLRLLDEAMVSVTAGETSPTISGLVYCAVINECHDVYDLRRAREWTTALTRWCAEQPGLVPYRGQCLVHRAQVLQLSGDWSAATAAVEDARRQLSDPPHPAVGMAHYQAGELHRLRGELREADDAYRRAHAAGREPQPGLALVRLAEGSADTAAASIEAALGSAPDTVARAGLLPASAEIMRAVGREEEEMAAVGELESLAEGDSTMLGAVADQARGSARLARGDADGAVGPLKSAFDAWQELGAPYEAAEARVLLAGACRVLGDRDRAELECRAARAVFEPLGAVPALDRLDRVIAGESPFTLGPDRASDRHPGVTERELEVLRLVAAGRTNRQIAGELAISEKTVERHLGNVYSKLGVSNRAAATAHAYDQGLL